MKLKYYLRGLGIGIAVTALLMGIAFSGHKETMTDEEIRQRALEMGMTDDESGVLADSLKGEEGESPDEGQNSPVSANETKARAEELAQQEEVKAPEPQNDETKGTEASKPQDEERKETKPQDEETEMPEMLEMPEMPGQPAEVVVITVNSGDGSRTVSNKLKEAGIIENADYFDDFLCQNGYDKRLASGAHEIPADASDEEIARILMQRPGRR